MRVLSPDDLRCPVSGKHAYPDETSAMERLHLIWTRPSERWLPYRVYLCPDCGWWHLSSSVQWAPKKLGATK